MTRMPEVPRPASNLRAFFNWHTAANLTAGALAIYGIQHTSSTFWRLVLLGCALIANDRLFVAYFRMRHPGPYRLLVCCDHQPEGAQLDGLDGWEVRRELRHFNPAHHLVWINDTPIYDWQRNRVAALVAGLAGFDQEDMP